MKKLLGAALSAALVFPSGPASAELLKNLKVNGGMDIQANSSMNITDFSTNQGAAIVPGGARTSFNDRIGNALTRTWVGMMWDMLDDVHAKATVRKNDRTWGTAGGSGANGAQGATGSQDVIGGSGANKDLASNIF